MKHTTEELLLAAQVRSIASAARASSIPKNLEGTELNEWLKANPVKNWLAPALEDLEFVADIIKNHQS